MASALKRKKQTLSYVNPLRFENSPLRYVCRFLEQNLESVTGKLSIGMRF